MASTKRILELLKVESIIKEPTNPIIVENYKKDIVFSKLNFYYHKNNSVFSNLNFTITGSEFLGIVGQTGSGKTTLAIIIKIL